MLPINPYIYRVGRTYPAINPIYISKSIKILICTRTPHGPVSSCRIGYSIQAGQTTWIDRSDQLIYPDMSSANFGRQHMLPLFFW
jgi:hypothetical protein